jgi:RHS repeat-associated protein
MYDSESGLNYNVARDYQPLQGRFVESDPTGLKSRLYSTFAYTNGNPLSFIDPRGRQQVINPEDIPMGPINPECYNWSTPSTSCPNDNGLNPRSTPPMLKLLVQGGLLTVSGIGVAAGVGELVFGTEGWGSMCTIGTAADVASLVVEPTTSDLFLEITAQVAGRWYNDGYITADTFASVLIGVFSGELRNFYNDVAKLFTTTDEPEEEPESPAPQNTPSQGQ